MRNDCSTQCESVDERWTGNITHTANMHTYSYMCTIRTNARIQIGSFVCYSLHTHVRLNGNRTRTHINIWIMNTMASASVLSETSTLYKHIVRLQQKNFFRSLSLGWACLGSLQMKWWWRVDLWLIKDMHVWCGAEIAYEAHKWIISFSATMVFGRQCGTHLPIKQNDS